MSALKVLHVIPSLNIGGVEVGILRSYHELRKSMVFEVFSIKGSGSLTIPRLSWVRIFKVVFKKHYHPDVVVSSLWLGHIVGFFLAVIFRARWVPFFHSARSEGFFRDLILRGAALSSRFAFFDSQSTHNYYRTHVDTCSQIIPYRFAPPAQNGVLFGERPFTCVFVGRLSPEKRIDLLVEYLSQLQIIFPDSRPLVVVSGERTAIFEFSSLLKSNGVVADVRGNVHPTKVFEILEQSALYLSFSDYEGFGMATVDAMTCGCVPVVRPVGELSTYVDQKCGILVNDISFGGLRAIVESSLALLNDTKRLRAYSARARLSVSRYQFYSESYLEGVKRALATNE